MFGFLLYLLAACLVGGLIYWLLTMLPIPQPFKNVVLIIFVVICIVWLLGVFFGGFPMPRPIFMR